MANRKAGPHPENEKPVGAAERAVCPTQSGEPDAAPVTGDPGGIASRAARYFEECDATRERVVLKNGDVRYRQTPYTLAGLCAALGVPRARLEELRQNADIPPEDTEFCALRDAVLRVEQHLVERALLGELDADMAALLLEGWGYVASKKGRAVRADSAEPEADPTMTVVLEDPEGLAR